MQKAIDSVARHLDKNGIALRAGHHCAQPAAAVNDVCTPVEFAEVHVPQARSVPLDELIPGPLQLPKKQPVYLLCRSVQRALKAAEKFAKEGFVEPIVVEGGRLAWIDANLPATQLSIRDKAAQRNAAGYDFAI